ncbi:MAG: hypothetical protein JO307_24630 [Bryobacterales bacterium]|nr:hypothetical protein [Bryobacterales bacterium]MBV9396840.1 hypothetical protein [Bryobacterales bacterium]
MDAKQKMALTGTGLVAAGIGLSVVGAMMIFPAVFEWVGDVVEKGSERFGARLEGVTKRAGTVAGSLQRSFREAAKAGVAEFKRDSGQTRMAGS